jgi:hypothetical protein
VRGRERIGKVVVVAVAAGDVEREREGEMVVKERYARVRYLRRRVRVQYCKLRVTG